MDYMNSKHFGYACDIANSNYPKPIVELCERIDELEQENERLRAALQDDEKENY
jgi:hypothetical protein